MKIQRDGGRLVWFCSGCGRPVHDGAGYLAVEVSHDDLPRVLTLAEVPDELAWRVWHTACDPTTDTYTVDVADVRTLNGVLDTTAQLIGKAWLIDSDWDSILRRVAEASSCEACANPFLTLVHSCGASRNSAQPFPIT